MKAELMIKLINILHKSWKLASKHNVLGATAKRIFKNSSVLQTNSLMNMIELIKKALRLGQTPLVNLRCCNVVYFELF